MTDLAPHSRPVALHVQVRVSADEINKLDPADLVWSTPTDLVAGDRVRVVATGRLGTIGFVNAERARSVLVDHAPQVLELLLGDLQAQHVAQELGELELGAVSISMS